MVSSESLNFLQPNLVWWCIIMSQIVFQTDWYAVFKIKITVKDHIIKLWLSELLIFLQLNLVWWHIITILWKDKKIVLLWSRSQERFKIPVNVHLEDISSTAEPSVTKLGVVMHHHDHGPECHARRLVCSNCCFVFLGVGGGIFSCKATNLVSEGSVTDKANITISVLYVSEGSVSDMYMSILCFRG